MPLNLPVPEPFVIFQVPLASFAAPVVPSAVSLNEPPLHFHVWFVRGMTSLPTILHVPNGLPPYVAQILVPCWAHGLVTFMLTLWLLAPSASGAATARPASATRPGRAMRDMFSSV